MSKSGLPAVRTDIEFKHLNKDYNKEPSKMEYL